MKLSKINFLLVALLHLTITAFPQAGLLDMTFNPENGNAQGLIGAIVIQTDGKIVVTGNSTYYNGAPALGLGRLNTDGSPDFTFLPVQAVENGMSLALQADGKILVGDAGRAVSGIRRFNTNGTLDAGFNIAAGGANGEVLAIKVQTDQKIVIGGRFTTYNGVSRNGIARINTDGTLDATFDPGTGIAAPSDVVETLEIQSDGKIFIGGVFANYNGTSVNNLARLNTDGTIDSGYLIGTGLNGGILTSALQPDGKIIISGSFTTYSGATSNRIERINTDGTRDTGFLSNAADGFTNGPGFSISVQTDNKIIVAGDFTIFKSGGVDNTRSRIIRLNANGTIDTSLINAGIDILAFATAIQTDGKIWVGGLFNTPRRGLARLNTNGTLDTTTPYTNGLVKNSTTFNSTVTCMGIQADGKTIITGAFNDDNGVNRIARLNQDGSRDYSFSGNADGNVIRVAFQGDGKMVLSGSFLNYNGTPLSRIARLNIDSSIDGGFNVGSGFDNSTWPVLAQADGKIMVGGGFLNYNGTPVSPIVRLNMDGTRDGSFNAPAFSAGAFIYDIVQQTDLKYIVTGLFTTVGGNARNNIVRLNADGTFDASFDPGIGADNVILSAKIMPNGQIIIGGNFLFYNSVLAKRIARLNTDGSLDASFASGNGLDGQVNIVALQPDGKILLGGNFLNVNFNPRKFLGRLNADGSFDASFNSGNSGPNNGVVFLDPIGDRILIGGNFTTYNGAVRKPYARLYNDFTSVVPTIERDALVALYNNNNGASWFRKTNWITGPVESWQGIKVTGGRVTNIDLSANNLTGIIPNQVGDLTQLKTIYLNNNALTAQDPLLAPKLPSLTSLEEINYSNNLLAGGIPPEIGSLSALRILFLLNNQLTGPLPTELGNLSNLIILDATNNKLSGSLPASLGSLSNLQSLLLGTNAFSGAVPSQLGQLANLVGLDLSLNRFQFMPDIFTNLNGLISVLLSSNKFSGPLPNSIGGLTNLQFLRIRDNYFNGLPSLAGLTALTPANFSADTNLFDFADIQANPASLNSSFNPQRQLNVGNIISSVGGVANFNGPPEATFGSGLLYQWTIQGSNIPGATSLNYSIPSVLLTDIGSYALTVTSSSTPGITLSYSIILDVKAEGQFIWDTGAGLQPDGQNTYSGAWGDMDNDGDEDLFVSRWLSHPNALYVNNGNGTFTPSNASFLSDINPARWSSWIDFNNDGKLDLVTAGSSGLKGSLGTAVYINQGNQNFTRQLLDGSNLYDAAVLADYNNDGKLDYALLTGTQDKIIDGATGVPLNLPFTFGGIGVPYFIDIDNDNDLDYYSSQVGPNPSQRILLNDGVGNLIENTTSIIVTDAASTTAANRGTSWFDIDNDGDVDLVSMHQGTAANTRIYLNDGAGNFTSNTGTAIFGEPIASRLSAHGDFDADGDQDFLIASMPPSACAMESVPGRSACGPFGP